MFVERIELVDFRSYGGASFSFHPKKNLIYGKNGSGKTNLLEAISLLSEDDSIRGAKNNELIKHGAPFASLKGVFRNDGRTSVVERIFEEKRTRTLLNGLPVRTSKELKSYPIVSFLPEMTAMFHAYPEARRRYIDKLSERFSLSYRKVRKSYAKTLYERNLMIKNPVPCYGKEMMAALDEKLVKEGTALTRMRAAMVKNLGEYAEILHMKLSYGKESLAIRYDSKLDPSRIEASFREGLMETKLLEREYRRTLIGPHLDDLTFAIDGKDAKRFASQGQLRTIRLALTLTEVELIKSIYHKMPILLLDDVYSELDEDRRRILTDTIEDGQIFLTDTDQRDDIHHMIEIPR